MNSGKQSSGTIFSKTAIRWLLTLATLGLFAGYFILNTDKFRPLLNINPLFLILIALGNVGFTVSSGLLTKYILRPFDKDLPLTETTYIALITSIGNFFAPVGAGLAFRAFYLKQKHKVPYGDYISILAGNYMIVFLVNSIFGLAALLLLRSRADAHYDLLVAAFAGLFCLTLLAASLKVPASLARKGGRLVSVLGKVSDGWRRIAHHKKLLLQLLFLTVLNLFLTAAIMWFIILSLHLRVGLGALLLFSVMSILSLFLNITPANLGVKEALYIFSAGVLGFSTNQIILIAVIDRGVSFIIIGGAYFILRLRGGYALKA